MRLAFFKKFLMSGTALHAVPHLHAMLTRPLPWSGLQEMFYRAAAGARR